MGTDIEGAEPREFLDKRKHLIWPGGTVESEAEKGKGSKACHKGLKSLPTERPSTLVTEGYTYHQRNGSLLCFHLLKTCNDGTFCHQGIEDRLYEEEVYPSLQQRTNLFTVHREERGKVFLSICWVFYLLREGERTVGRTKNPCNEGISVMGCFIVCCCLTCNFTGSEVNRFHFS